MSIFVCPCAGRRTRTVRGGKFRTLREAVEAYKPTMPYERFRLETMPELSDLELMGRLRKGEMGLETDAYQRLFWVVFGEKSTVEAGNLKNAFIHSHWRREEYPYYFLLSEGDLILPYSKLGVVSELGLCIGVDSLSRSKESKLNLQIFGNLGRRFEGGTTGITLGGERERKIIEVPPRVKYTYKFVRAEVEKIIDEITGRDFYQSFTVLDIPPMETKGRSCHKISFSRTITAKDLFFFSWRDLGRMIGEGSNLLSILSFRFNFRSLFVTA